MSVLIKGIEMPQSCYDCSFQHPCKHDEDKDYCVVIDDFLYCYNMEANNCPLVEIPPHGRLIDADAVLNAIKKAMEDDSEIADVYKEDYAAVSDWLYTAPTVIPADNQGGDVK